MIIWLGLRVSRDLLICKRFLWNEPGGAWRRRALRPSRNHNAVWDEASNDCSWLANASGWGTASGHQTRGQLTSNGRLEFKNQKAVLDIHANAGPAVKLIAAILGKDQIMNSAIIGAAIAG